jgi:hypothetical protein
VAAALTSLHATICSHLFWPELQEHEMRLPQDMETALEVSHRVTPGVTQDSMG